MDRRLTAALVLETNNLAGGGAGAERVTDSLARLLEHLRGQTRPLASLADLVVTHDGLESAQRSRLEAAAGRGIRFVALPRGTGYYQAKNLGFDATSADLVAFGDADCWPEPAWLDRLLAPLEVGGAVAVAGRTTYRRGLLGTAATTIDFMYFPSPLGGGCTKNFYANNVAFRREVFMRYRYAPADGVYRGHCQILGMRLFSAGVPVRFEPRARTTHRFPDSARELVRLRLLRGQDTVAVTPHLAQTYLPASVRWVGRAPGAALATLAIRLGYSLAAINHQDMPEVHGLRRLACAGSVAALSLLDGAGALAGTLRPARSGLDAAALSYHRDVDHLADRQAA